MHSGFSPQKQFGNLSRSYHSTEIHALHWLLSPNELYKLCNKNDNFLFSEIEEFVTQNEDDDQKEEKQTKRPRALCEYFEELRVASSGEDGLMQIVSIKNGETEIEAVTAKHAISSHEAKLIRSSQSRRNSAVLNFKQKELQQNSFENECKYPNAFDAEMYDEWVLNFNPTQPPSSNVIQFVRQSIMEQNSGSRFPLKCCDMVRKSTGDAYLFFAGGAKEYLQAYEV